MLNLERSSLSPMPDSMSSFGESTAPAEITISFAVRSTLSQLLQELVKPLKRTLLSVRRNANSLVAFEQYLGDLGVSHNRQIARGVGKIGVRRSHAHTI